jgi:biopolymer transport protein ExbD/biopolymer transport protein TolR
MLSKSIPVDLVKTHNPVKMKEADKEDAVVVAVTRDSRIFLSPGNNQISLDNLASKVADLQTNRSDKTVYIKADARAKYETVENVVDTLRTDKVENLGLLTEEIQDRNRRNSEL